MQKGNTEFVPKIDSVTLEIGREKQGSNNDRNPNDYALPEYLKERAEEFEGRSESR